MNLWVIQIIIAVKVVKRLFTFLHTVIFIIKGNYLKAARSD